MYDEGQSSCGDLHDRLKALLGIVRNRAKETCIHHECIGGDQKGLAVGTGACRRLGPDVATRTWLVFDDHRFIQALSHFLADDTCEQIRPPCLA